MSKIGLVIQREYVQRVSKKSFILLTFLTPILFAALVFVPLWLSSIKGDEVKKIAVLDQTGKYAPLLKNTEEIDFVVADGDMDSYRKDSDKAIYAFLSIDGDLLQNPKAAVLYSQKQIPMSIKAEVAGQLDEMLRDEKLASFNIPNLKEIIEESKVSCDVQTIKWEEDGSANTTSAEVASIAGFILTFLIYMFIIMYGAMVMQGVMEEKTNRIMEVMISSVRPFDLMMGKIIGIGMVGLTQVFLWAILTSVLLAGALFLLGGDASQAVDMMAANQINQAAVMTNPANPSVLKLQEILNSIQITQLGINFVLYFIGGYLMYASLFAAIGSAVDQQEDSSQFMTPMMVLMVFALYAGIYSVENPDGPLAFWCSLIPLTSPIVMMVRLPFDIPLWENLLSLALLFGTAVACVWVSGKIYRVGVLMYGKKPSIMEIIRWINYKG